jgi:hypothetical protein
MASISHKIQDFLTNLPQAKQSEMQWLHQQILDIAPNSKLWFDTGIDENNKVVCNPTIGYGTQTLHYANGSTKEFFQIGISPNTTGISIYFMGLKDKKYLFETYGQTLGKANITGYCIKFKTLKDLNTKVLEEALKFGLQKV